jgi:hypothetical protein
VHQWEISRREFVNRAALTAAAAVLAAELPGLLQRKGWLEAALAQSADLTHDTLNGLVAFVVPGRDEYSLAQGEKSDQPGAIEAGTTDALIELLDAFVPLGPSGTSLPSSGGVATYLNQTALAVNPAASNGGFASPFSRLSFEDKIEVFRRLEEDTTTVQGSAQQAGELRFVAGILVGAVGFLAYGEHGVLDPKTRELKGTPVGWQISNYDGIAEGRAELKGYWQGRRKVRTARRYRRRRR